MSESQISAVMATVHSSINGDEVNNNNNKNSPSQYMNRELPDVQAGF